MYKRCEEVPTVEYSAKVKEAYIQYMKEHHSKHIEELNRKYGGDEEPEYSEWDRSLISKIKQ